MFSTSISLNQRNPSHEAIHTTSPLQPEYSAQPNRSLRTFFDMEPTALKVPARSSRPHKIKRESPARSVPDKTPIFRCVTRAEREMQRLKTHVFPKKTRVCAEETRVLAEETRVCAEETRVLPPETFVCPQKTRVSSPYTHVWPRKTHVSPP